MFFIAIQAVIMGGIAACKYKKKKTLFWRIAIHRGDPEKKNRGFFAKYHKYFFLMKTRVHMLQTGSLACCLWLKSDCTIVCGVKKRDQGTSTAMCPSNFPIVVLP